MERARKRLAALYLDLLEDCPLQLPGVARGFEHAWHLFVVRTAQRDGLQADLAAAGVDTLIHYPTPPHLQAAYRRLGLAPGALPLSERIHREVLSLPLSPQHTEEQIRYVAAQLRAAVANRKVQGR
jgi:dTDP-4-amino-4,6-dideoxygalactose transaminase